MVKFDCILVRYGEIGLKGANRGSFERRLAGNMRWSLKKVGASFRGIRRIQGRFVIETEDKTALDAMSKVFGVVSYSPATKLAPDMESMCEAAVNAILESDQPTFRITAQRLDKRFAMTSQEINEAVGEYVTLSTSAKVSLKNPQMNIGLDLTKDTVYLHTSTMRGLGGLPVGSSARVLCLLSGGIDSPVAAWLMMKRGCPVTLVHFMHESTGRTPKKIERLYISLSGYGPGMRLILVPAAGLEREIIMNIPSRDRIVMLRRMFLKAAVKLMVEENAHAIVTGDNVGQVASQTVENMEAVQEGMDALVLRPLSGFDKQEIVDMAKKAGTYDDSTAVYADCCSLLLPKHPSTRTSRDDVVRLDSLINDDLVSRILPGKRIIGGVGYGGP